MNTQPMVCPHCSYVNATEASSCARCGAVFGTMQQQTQIDMPSPFKICAQCQTQADLTAKFCPNCGSLLQSTFVPPARIYPMPPTMAPYPVAEPKSKVAAALFALFLGGFGAHGFYINNNTMGAVLLAISLASIPLMLILVGFVTLGIVHLICLIQAILYLSASDYDFQRKYVEEGKWF